MKARFKISYFFYLALVAMAQSIAMQQPQPMRPIVPRVITQISNHMKDRKVIVIFDSDSHSVEANKDFFFAAMIQLAATPTEQLIAQHKGFPINLYQSHLFIATPLGVATILGGGDSTVLQFDPFSGKYTIEDSKATQLHIIVDEYGHVSLVNAQAKLSKAP